MHVQAIPLRVPDTLAAVSVFFRHIKQAAHALLCTVKPGALAKETDPRAAAAAIAVSIAECAGPLDVQQEAVLCREFRQVLRASDGRELLAHGRWLTRNVSDPNMVCDRVARLLNTQLWRAQKESLLEMVLRVSDNSAVQRQAARHLKTKLCL